MSDILIAFRTHIWDDATKQLAYKLYSETTDFDFIILLDETQEVINVSPLEKISHTFDQIKLDLPSISFPCNSLHYNGDYPLYILRKTKPHYKFYAMLEGDMSVNIDLQIAFQNCIKKHIDFVGNITEIDKQVINDTLKLFPIPGKVFFPFIAASDKLIDALYQKRLELKTEYNHQFVWPYCEFFVGSYLASNPYFKTVSLKEIADLTDFTWKDHKHIHDPRVYKKGTIIHPVVSSSRFIDMNLQSNDVTNIFNKHSTLYSGIQYEDPLIFLPQLEQKIKEKNDPKLLIKFWDFALCKGWINQPHPITISSELVDKNLVGNEIETIFDEKSILFLSTQNENPLVFLPKLEQKIKEKKDPELLIKFWNFALLQRWINLPHPINIAFAKPAIQSSICSASRFRDVRQDASLLVDGILEHSSRSHTDHEERPWVMIDLINQYEVRSILIYVRPDCYPAFCDFSIELSDDNQNWSTIYSKIDGIISDSANMQPIIINIDRNHIGRFIKITQETAGWMHLNQIEIYSY